MTKSIAMQALRNNLSRVVGEVAYGDQTYVVDNYGRPAVVLMSVKQFERLTSTPLLGLPDVPAHVISPRLADSAQTADFEMEVTEN